MEDTASQLKRFRRIPDPDSALVVVSKLGSGISGTVFEAELRIEIKTPTGKLIEPGQTVAVKKINAVGVATFTEIDALKRASAEGCPSVVQLFDVWYDSGAENWSGKPSLYFIMEYIAGENLEKWMRQLKQSSHDFPFNAQKGDAALQQVLFANEHFVMALCAGLRCLHNNRVVHRDIKLDNIMWDSRHPGTTVKWIDLGFACLDLCQKVSGVGNIHTQAPELRNGTANAQSDAFEMWRLADIWAFGVTVFELLTGRPTNAQEKGRYDEPVDPWPLNIIQALVKPDNIDVSVNMIRNCTQAKPTLRQLSATPDPAEWIGNENLWSRLPPKQMAEPIIHFFRYNEDVWQQLAEEWVAEATDESEKQRRRQKIDEQKALFL